MKSLHLAVGIAVGAVVLGIGYKAGASEPKKPEPKPTPKELDPSPPVEMPPVSIPPVVVSPGGPVDPATGETTPLPDYAPAAKCPNGFPCWVLVDPLTAVPVPTYALTTPLKVGDVVSYYLADEVNANDSTYLMIVTATVTGAKIATPSNEYGSYPIKVTNAALLRGKAPTKLPPVGFETAQWRFRMIGGVNYFA